jgi:AcrR family transcriptional regulator
MLFRRQGYAGTGIKAIATEAAAPLGSIYHFFPGGKDELTAEVIRAAGHAYGQLVPLFFDGEPDVAVATRNAFRGAAETLRASDYADACPIATVALEVASTNEALRLATMDVFTGWIDLIAERYAATGLDAATARGLATALVVNLEGAFVLARAMRDPGPVELAGETLFAAVRAAQSKAGQEMQ